MARRPSGTALECKTKTLDSGLRRNDEPRTALRRNDEPGTGLRRNDEPGITACAGMTSQGRAWRWPKPYPSGTLRLAENPPLRQRGMARKGEAKAGRAKRAQIR
jgi:hypothetical protein